MFQDVFQIKKYKRTFCEEDPKIKMSAKNWKYFLLHQKYSVTFHLALITNSYPFLTKRLFMGGKKVFQNLGIFLLRLKFAVFKKTGGGDTTRKNRHIFLGQQISLSLSLSLSHIHQKHRLLP